MKLVKRLDRRLILLGLLLLWMGIIFALSHQPGTGQEWEPPLWYVVERKSAHVFEYAILTAIAAWFFRSFYPREPLARVLLLSVVLAVAYGFLDEVHQSFIFGRGARVTDVFFDAVGATVTVLVFWALRKKLLVSRL